MRLDQTYWITPSQLVLLASHNVTTLQQLASLELADSMADAIPVPDLRKLAKRARQSLGHGDPLAQIGAAVGQRPGTPVAYAGGVKYDSEKG